METYLSPSAEQIAQIENMALDGPVVVINLLRFNRDGGWCRTREPVVDCYQSPLSETLTSLFINLKRATPIVPFRPQTTVNICCPFLYRFTTTTVICFQHRDSE
jgi:hypothetical protein